MTPAISVILASRSAEPEALDHLARVDYPPDRLEVLVATGRNPGRQRNLAAAAATGEILYFLDDDSRVSPDLFRRAAELFTDPTVWGVCGPNLATAERSLVERWAGAVWTAFPGIGPRRARYCPVGRLREARDCDLIGCNLAIRRSSVQAVGGFDERYFPDEENELVERLRSVFPAEKLLYCPDLVVLRPRPSSLGEYLRKIFVYGWARARRLGHRPAFWTSLSALPALLILCWLVSLSCGAWGPGSVYLALAGLATGYDGWRRGGRWLDWLGLLAGCLVTHLVYGLGQWFGLVHRRPLVHDLDAEVRVQSRPIAL